MKSCNRKILELFYNAKHTGRITKPDAIGRVGEDDDGLVIEITWRVIGGVIAEAKFRAFANPNAIAITSLMIDNIIGKTVDEAIVIGENVIIDNLGEFRPEYLEVYDMVRECIAEAYNNYLKRQSRTAMAEVQEFDYEEYRATHELDEDEEFDYIKIQRELQTSEISTERRGRGRPRKEVDPNAVVEVGEKRGRGRPRKEVDPNAIIEVGEKRGRGRPRKERPEVDETIETVKRGRGRPRKIVDESEIVEIGEKRGRGRPRKEVDPNVIVEVGEKRGRGRPRKIVDESEIVEIGEKRGRGRPRKEVDPNAVVEVGEKRGRGRPRKEVKYNLPTDLDEVVEDEEFEQLINGNNHVDKEEFIDNLTSGKLLDEDDETFEEDYDLFKSNIRNIFTGKEISNQNYGQVKTEVREESKLQASAIEQVEELEDEELENNEVTQSNEVTEIAEVKRGRGRPRKEVDPNQVVEVGEKRGRGRPKKIVDESEIIEVGEKRGRGRPRKVVEETLKTTAEIKTIEIPAVKSVNSLTRTLSPNGLPPHSTQEIVFASKNVKTTNINVTKTTINIAEDNKAIDYSDINISSVKHEIKEPVITDVIDEPEIEEVEIEPVKPITQNTFKNFEDFDDEEDDDYDESDDENFDEDIVDEAPKGGIEDLLKALLDD